MDLLSNVAKKLNVYQNVSLRVLDATTGEVVQEHIGHNSATNSMLLGIGYYLIGTGVFNQASSTLSNYLPKYISLGTMGLKNQNYIDGVPTGISTSSDEAQIQADYEEYMFQVPGFSADGSGSAEDNNNRPWFGLGKPYDNFNVNASYAVGDVVYHNGMQYVCITAIDGNATNSWDDSKWSLDATATAENPWHELVSPTFRRVPISYREVIPSTSAENERTIDVVLSAMISSGALAQFRGTHDYIFITEAALWNSTKYIDGAYNGMLAGYRIVPNDKINWDMSVPENRAILRNSILRVGKNQVVQVVWKIQLGALNEIQAIAGDSQWHVAGGPAVNSTFEWIVPGGGN